MTAPPNTFSINWARKAVKQWLKFPTADRIRITAEITRLQLFPALSNIKALSNHEFGYRLRVGQYRVLFDVRTEIRIIDIQEVRKRDDNTY
ncbi:mRNA-degrading endonuclease RelE of RelBE toxin-antitoxin system [Achromobacter deleyi]|nr:type II toxin-antitoxin system RelE/ParE family toxin [Achromobacter deleyi]MDR6602858.1 mRNA-degrading endonuclease RelE of RelBE toxin-antitoxin system [Achromobacter deleyi]